MFGDTPNTSIKTKKRLMTFVIVWLTLFFGLRWECGTDWDQYYWIFKEVSWGNFLNMNRYGDQNVEPLFAFVNVFLKTIGMGSYTFYLLVTNAIRFTLMAYASFKLSKYPLVTFFGFLSVQYYFPTRNPYATAIFMAAYIFIVNKDLRKYIYTWLAACAVHISSVMVVPIYWLYGFRIKYLYQVAIYVGSILLERLLTGYLQTLSVLLSVGSATFSDKVETYTQAFREEGSRSLIQYALPLFFLTLFEYARKKTRFETETEQKRFDFYVVCYLIALCIINVLQPTMPDLTRYAEFVNTWPLLIPFVLNIKPKYRKAIVCVVLAYYVYRLNNSINLGEYKDLFIPYHSIFD